MLDHRRYTSPLSLVLRLNFSTDGSSLGLPMYALLRCSAAAFANTRGKHPKNSVGNRTWKEIGNSVYGKLAQGLREKRVYDSRLDTSAILPRSAITQAYLAAYTTSFIRAVLGDLLNRIPNDREVLSVTTDGFITNAPKEALDVSGPLARMFAELTYLMAETEDFLETKHIVPSVLCFKTRGQLTVGVLDSKMPTITAKAGHKPPEDVLEGAKRASPRTCNVLEVGERSSRSWTLRVTALLPVPVRSMFSTPRILVLRIPVRSSASPAPARPNVSAPRPPSMRKNAVRDR